MHTSRHLLGLCGLVGLAVAAAPSASAAFYTVPTPSYWYGWTFNPVTGAFIQGFTQQDPSLPLAIAVNSPGAFIGLNSSLNAGTNFSLAGHSITTFAFFSAGAVIDATTSFSAGTGTSYLSENDLSYDGATLRYIGFRYQNQGVGGNETYYGWAEFTARTGGFDGDEMSLRAFGVGGPGQGVITGSTTPIPEPGAFALLAGVGVLGFASTRRRAHS